METNEFIWTVAEQIKAFNVRHNTACETWADVHAALDAEDKEAWLCGGCTSDCDPGAFCGRV